jgi:hypothetical protein
MPPLRRAGCYSKLAQTIKEFDPLKLEPFPDLDSTRFRDLLDEEMGYV